MLNRLLVALLWLLTHCGYASSHDVDVDTALPVSGAAAILYAGDFSDQLLNISEQVIMNALTALQNNPGSYTVVSATTPFCVYTNSHSGVRFMVDPKATGTYSASHLGENQDIASGDVLQFYNVELGTAMPYFLIVKPNQKAATSSLLGAVGPFTVGASLKPFGSALPHLQAGVWGVIDHYDVTSNLSASAQFGGCPGTAIDIQIAVLNRDLVAVSSGKYVGAFQLNIDAIDD